MVILLSRKPLWTAKVLSTLNRPDGDLADHRSQLGLDNKLTLTLKNRFGVVVFSGTLRNGKLMGQHNIAGRVQGTWEAKKRSLGNTDRPVRAADLIRGSETAQQGTVGNSTQHPQEFPAPCDAARPEILVLPNKKAQIDLRPNCWSSWIRVPDSGWQFKTLGDSQLIEIMFKDGYHYMFRSRDDDFQIDPGRIRIFRFRGTGQVEVVAY